MMKINAQRNKTFDVYYQALKDLRGLWVTNEEGLRPAFQGLMTTFGKEKGWTLVLEQALPNGCEPDGTLRDSFNLPRGYWEAKDTKDDLETEIKKKISKGYPTTNIIFEDTEHGVLWQNGKRVLDVDLRQPRQLADLLELFFNFTEPNIARFEDAVGEFKERIPELAQGLLERIRQELRANKKFVQAFEAFRELCRSALDPKISVEAIEEMLVQHLLTERLFRTIFNNPDFTQRNIIAAEIEKVIQVLTSRAFNRMEFLKQLDRFYVAIEEAAKTTEDWSEKQRFMDTVYQRFFQGFAVKQADIYGIVYTPPEIVEFMVASVEQVLQWEFGLSLSSEGVQVLDPSTGTGSFIVSILRLVAASALERKYKQELFCNEIMLLPYYIASLNIEHVYYERTGQYLPFEGICFADTLDMVTEGQPAQLPGFSEANTERVERESQAEITVIIGNPPYNVGQQNENDNNKNRQYKQVDGRIRDTYAQASEATLKMQLYDAYVKFFRWATDRLGNRDGIICFVSNNSLVRKLAFDGMRKHLARDFSYIYHLDLGGDAREGGGGNVFGIKVGVGITVLVRNRNHAEPPYTPATIFYHQVDNKLRSTEKLSLLAGVQSITNTEWQELQPDENYTWLTEGMRSEFVDFLPIGTKEAKASSQAIVEAIFATYSGGVKTDRDSVVYDFNSQALMSRVEQFIEDYNAEVFRWSKSDRSKSVDNFVRYDKVKWSEHLKGALQRERYGKFDGSKVRVSLYRPFCQKYLYFDSLLNDRPGLFEKIFPLASSAAENVVIVVSDHGYRAPFSTLVTSLIPELHLLASTDMFQCFPFYTYAEDGSNRQETITDWALRQFQTQYGNEVSKWDIFHYVYALLHHPAYRERYAENLKRELPRIPLVPDREAFVAFVQAGARLATLHLNYEQAEEYPLQHQEMPGERFSYIVKKMRLSQDKQKIIYNDALTLTGVPSECFNYRLGNRSALEWIIDQYQVSTDTRSGIITDPNREDDEQYIVRLVKQVITVSLETVKLVASLPPLPEFGQQAQEDEEQPG
ncbi:MAG TPA: type ISP restriction/modification enzyme [Ktedonobacterales bacterium]|nr:type ISP restriction/modification enzyme [Ktedonobacterales bacterium]